VEQLSGGDSKPLAFLIGAMMKKTSGRAEPGAVKALLQERFGLSFVQVLSMGGAIAGRRGGDGEVSAGDLKPVIDELSRGGELPRNVRFEELEISRILSEEINPEDWAALAAALQTYLKQENVSGVVVAHGTDTLAYTASLLFWLFPEPEVPVVLTASLEPAGAPAALREAILAASSRPPGLYVALEGQLLSALNVKFERVAPGGFRNWNLPQPLYRAGSLGAPAAALAGVLGDRAALKQRLEQAIAEACIVRVYPGLRADYLIALMNVGVRHFVLELYDTGTANLRESPFSLRRAFAEGRERGVNFFCTSQQEGIVDFSGYVTSHELWREGAVPMGYLTTESAYTRLLALRVATESPEQILRLMEEANANAAG
jgi:aspartyl-tRNA(Asn)/glutamyl-tRNA(Gln) amidotransferase subunit B